jgi:hypothetical protein
MKVVVDDPVLFNETGTGGIINEHLRPVLRIVLEIVLCPVHTEPVYVLMAVSQCT